MTWTTAWPNADGADRPAYPRQSASTPRSRHARRARQGKDESHRAGCRPSRRLSSTRADAARTQMQGQFRRAPGIASVQRQPEVKAVRIGRVLVAGQHASGDGLACGILLAHRCEHLVGRAILDPGRGQQVSEWARHHCRGAQRACQALALPRRGCMDKRRAQPGAEAFRQAGDVVRQFRGQRGKSVRRAPGQHAIGIVLDDRYVIA